MLYRPRFAALPALLVGLPALLLGLTSCGEGPDAKPVDHNARPSAADRDVAVDEDESVAIVLSGSDADADEITFSVTTEPAHGLLIGTAPNVNYTPNANFNGTDTFTYLVNDGALDSEVGTVTITVKPVNDAPVVADLAHATAASTPLEVTLTAQEVDDDALTFAVIDQPTAGVLSGEAPNLVYTPGPEVKGEFSFTYKANDGTVDSNVATVTIKVAENDEQPTADDLALETEEDQPLDVTLVGADTEGAALTFTVAENPQGTLTGTAPNLTYTPPQDFNGEDTFTYRSNDGGLDSRLATVTLTVTPVGDPPTALDDALTVGNGATATELDGGATSLLDNDVDPDGDGLTVTTTPMTDPVNGAVTLNADGTFSYTHDRSTTTTDSFEYEVCDDSVDAVCVTATVTVLVRDNILPVVGSAAIEPVGPREGDTLTCALANVVDADDDNVSVSYSWTVNGQPVDGAVAATLDDTNWIKGDVVACTVIPNDGKEDGLPTVSADATILNRGPIATVVTVTGIPKIGETLTCAYSGYSDIDGDLDSGLGTYSWLVNGSAAGTGNTITGGFVRDDVVVCVVNAHDGFDFGADSLSAGTTIVNTVPEIVSVSITPSPAKVLNRLTCNYTGYSDADSDADASTYAWTINGDPAGTSRQLAGGYKRDDDVVCTVTPHDGLGGGTAVASDATKIINTAPAAPLVRVSPEQVQEGVDIIKCRVAGGSLDPDNDAITYTVAWEADGLPYPGADYPTATGPGTEWNTGDLIPAADTLLATNWKCIITPNDGFEDGAVGSAIASSGDQPGPLTVGETASGSNKVLADGYYWAQPVSLGADATVSAFGLNMVAGTKVIMGLYTDAGGSPGTKIIETSFVSVVAGVNTLAVTNPSLVTAGNYFIVANFENGLSPNVVSSAANSETTHGWTDGGEETLPDTAGTTASFPGERLGWWLIGL